MMSKPGELVRSLAGHDKDEYYLVLKVEGEILTLINGRNKKITNPKLKKQKHVQVISGVNEEILSRIENGKLIDADVIHMLRMGKEKENV